MSRRWALLFVLLTGCRPTHSVAPVEPGLIAERESLPGPAWYMSLQQGASLNPARPHAVFTDIYGPQHPKRTVRWRMDWRSIEGRVRWYGWGYFPPNIHSGTVNVSWSYTTAPDTAGTVWYDLTYNGEPPVGSGHLWEDYFRAEASAGLVAVRLSYEQALPYLHDGTAALAVAFGRDTLTHIVHTAAPGGTHDAVSSQTVSRVRWAVRQGITSESL